MAFSVVLRLMLEISHAVPRLFSRKEIHFRIEVVFGLWKWLFVGLGRIRF